MTTPAGDGHAQARSAGDVFLPRTAANPLRSARRRLLIAVAVLLMVALVVWLDSDGYKDLDGNVTFVDALYYASVSVSTTGYGDIAPTSDRARLVNIVVITPLRALFVIVLVGTTLEIVTATAREQIRRQRFRRALRGHTVVVGYGTRGRAAARTLLGEGADRMLIVAVDTHADAIADATEDGIAAVVGDGSRDEVLLEAVLEQAGHVVVAVPSDAAAVLVTLTARRLNPQARLVASVRASENAPLLVDSGADSVIVSSETAGRLLGVAVTSPPSARVLTELLTPAREHELHERAVRAEEVGRPPRESPDLVLAVLRDGQRLPFHADGIGPLREDDRVVVLGARPAA